MKTLTKSSSLISFFFPLLIAGSVFAALYGRPAVKVFLVGTVERNHQPLTLEKAGLLNPGEILQWTIKSQNDGNAPAHHYKTIGEIPPGTSYVIGSARAEGNVGVVYSIDGGQSFEAKPMIDQKQPDGSVRKVAAPASSYTHVRYEWNDPLSEGKQVSAFYKVRVK